MPLFSSCKSSCSYPARTVAGISALALALSMGLPSLHAQTLATGDLRGTLSEPVFPAVCATLPADLTIVSGEPTLGGSNNAAELNVTTDTANLQADLSLAACAGKAVEVTLGSSGQNAIVISPIYIPKTVTLLVDGGVTIFASRNASDYQIGTASSGNTCGTTDGGSACYPLISLGQTSRQGTSQYTGSVVTGIMGYGVINGRGYDKLITISGSTVTVGSSSWWDNAVGGNEDSPILVYSYKTAATQLYKISILNSPHFHVKITGQGNTSSPSNITIWGIKLLTPWSPHNTDGIDPGGVNNMTVTNSVIGDGDDESAISGSSPGANITYNNLLLASGHGLSIGSITSSAVTNVLYQNVNFSGQSSDGNEIALRIKSYAGASGGLVSQITYNNVCIRNVAAAIELDPFYASGSGTAPDFGTAAAPITYQNVYVLTPASYINLQGDSTYTSNVFLNNVYVNGSSLALNEIQSYDKTATSSATPYDANLTLNGTYYPSQWASLASTPNNVTESTNATSAGTAATLAAGFPAAFCANAFPTLMGELYASTTTGGVTTNNITPAATTASAAAVTVPATVTLNAVVQPTNAPNGYSSATAAAAPTAGVEFYDGATPLGSASLGANGTLASLIVTNPTAGTHTYTAQYLGDSTYAALTFGANTVGTEAQTLTVQVTAGPASQLAFTTAPPSTLVYGNAPGTVSVTATDAAGDVPANTPSITLTVTGPGNATVYTATQTANSSGVASFNLSSVLGGVGSYSFSATATGTSTATASETVTAATLTVTATSTSRAFDTTNPAFTYGITGYVNGDSSNVVSGAPTLSTAALRNSPAGTYSIVVGTGTLSAANYTFATTSGTLTVNGGAPQTIQLYPLPNFPAGGTYQLTATSTSGLAVTYTVSGGGASVTSAGALTVPGGTHGTTITVTAQQSGNGSSYAAATNVQRSFVAQ